MGIYDKGSILLMLVPGSTLHRYAELAAPKTKQFEYDANYFPGQRLIQKQSSFLLNKFSYRFFLS